jgi:cob(I)alamin adenosyltransferase
VEKVLEMIKIKPSQLNLVLTGNHAKPEVIEAADLVTEMREIKHPFQQGIRAKKGIDF